MQVCHEPLIEPQGTLDVSLLLAPEHLQAAASTHFKPLTSSAHGYPPSAAKEWLVADLIVRKIRRPNEDLL